MRDTFENHRTGLLDGLRRFVVAARSVAGVRQIAVVGSIVTTKPNPKDIDVLVVVADDADLAPLAKHARQLYRADLSLEGLPARRPAGV